MDPNFTDVADDVFVRHHRRLRLNIGLVVGAERCLVIDTRETLAQAEDLRAAVRRITPLPWVVVNTHGHHDHAFGNAAFAPCEIWGHRGCRAMLADYGDVQREIVRRLALEDGDEQLAAQLLATPLAPPDRLFEEQATIDLGGRTVHLRHLGRGHTDNDVVVEVPGAALFAGDLVEEGDPPAFEDAFPLDWPATATHVSRLAAGLPVVPGHGGVVDDPFVVDQQALLEAVARAARAAFAAERPVTEAATTTARGLDLPDRTAKAAMERAYRQLRGEPAYPSPAEVRGALGPGPGGA